MGMLPTYAPSGIDLRQLYFNAPAPPPTLTAPHQTLGQKLSDYISSKAQQAGLGKRFAGKLGALPDYTPIGAATTAYDLGQDLRQGQYGSAIANGVATALNAVPDVGPVAKGMFAAKGGAALHSIIAPLFHGSPHKFEKFALEKIGTGEGAQAYGHGLYFAENPQVAKEYQANLSPVAGETWGYRTFGRDEGAAQLLNAFKGDIDAALAHAENFSGRAGRNPYVKTIPDLKALKKEGQKRLAGHFYEVKLDANPEDFLNWDSPIGQQKVAQTLGFSSRPADQIHAEAEQIMMAHPNGAWMGKPDLRARIDALQAELDRKAPDLAGADFYRQTDPTNYLHSVLRNGNTDAERSQELLKQGVPGIRYLDQGSRGAVDVNNLRGSLSMWESALEKAPNDSYAAQQVESIRQQLEAAGKPLTHNYVVFDPSIIDILNRR